MGKLHLGKLQEFSRHCPHKQTFSRVSYIWEVTSGEASKKIQALPGQTNTIVALIYKIITC
jgi:hypothetical protein